MDLEKIDKLYKKKEKAEKEKIQTEHCYNLVLNRLEYRKEFSRKERTHHLIVVGAIVEQYYPEIKELGEVEFGDVIRAFHNADDHQRLREIIEKVKAESVDPSDADESGEDDSDEEVHLGDDCDGSKIVCNCESGGGS